MVELLVATVRVMDCIYNLLTPDRVLMFVCTFHKFLYELKSKVIMIIVLCYCELLTIERIDIVTYVMY